MELRGHNITSNKYQIVLIDYEKTGYGSFDQSCILDILLATTSA